MWTGLGRTEESFWSRSPAQIVFVLESVAEIKALEAGGSGSGGTGSGPGPRKGGPVEFAALVGGRKGVRAHRRRRKDRNEGDG